MHYFRKAKNENIGFRMGDIGWGDIRWLSLRLTILNVSLMAEIQTVKLLNFR